LTTSVYPALCSFRRTSVANAGKQIGEITFTTPSLAVRAKANNQQKNTPPTLAK
jgi:hypothetical protein